MRIPKIRKDYGCKEKHVNSVGWRKVCKLKAREVPRMTDEIRVADLI